MKPTPEMISRFLGWKLPPDFFPDAGISFDKEYGAKWGMPTGTNLFTADQAKAMLEHILGDYHDTAPRCLSCGGWVKPQEGDVCAPCHYENEGGSPK